MYIHVVFLYTGIRSFDQTLVSVEILKFSLSSALVAKECYVKVGFD